MTNANMKYVFSPHKNKFYSKMVDVLDFSDSTAAFNEAVNDAVTLMFELKAILFFSTIGTVLISIIGWFTIKGFR